MSKTPKRKLVRTPVELEALEALVKEARAVTAKLDTNRCAFFIHPNELKKLSKAVDYLDKLESMRGPKCQKS